MGTPGISVCLVTGEFPPQIGGLGDYTHYLATALAEAGAQANILTAADAQPAKTSSPPHQDALPYQLSHSINGWGRGLFTGVERHIERLQPQVVHIQYQTGAYGMQPAINLLPRWLRWRRPDLRVVTTFHDFRDPYLFAKAGPLRRWVTRRLAQDSHGVILTNHDDDHALMALGRSSKPNTVAHIPIGSNLPTRTPTPEERVAARRQLGAEAEDYLLGYFGLLHPTKGVETLIEALKLLHSDGLPASLVMVGGQDDVGGESGYRAAIQRTIAAAGLAQFVHWTGYLPPQHAASMLSAVNCCVLPFADGASLRHGSLIATLALGAPLVTTRPSGAAAAVGAMTHLPELQDDVHCRLAPQGSAEQLAAAIKRLLQSPEERQRLSCGALEFARAFTWDTIAEQTLAFYQHILDPKKS